MGTSLYWYIYVELFNQFRTFFMVVFQFLHVVFTIPLCLRFSHDGILVVVLMACVRSLMSSYADLTDMALMAAMICLAHFKGVVRQDTLFLLLIHAATVVLVSVIGAGSMNGGKVNIVYGIGLAIKIVEILMLNILLSDYTSFEKRSLLEAGFDLAHP